jgi:ParB/RepB/Spo0J family partition protein
MGEQIALVPPPEKTVATIPVSQIAGAEETIPPASLVGSMARDGQLTPIIVEFNMVAGTPPFTVVAGRRRVAAARHLGWEEIDAIIYERGDINPAQIGLIENAMRSSNPVSELRMIHDLEREGATDQEIAARTGMNPATIKKRKQLESLDTEAVVALGEGRLAIGVAEEMAKLPLGVQGRVLNEHRGKRITAKDVRKAREVQQQEAWGLMTFDIPGITTPPHWKQALVSHLEAALSVIPREEKSLTVLNVETIIADLLGFLREEGSDADSGSA